MSEINWQWFASRDEENYTVGPEPTREAVIQVATEDFDGDSFFIVEAISDNLPRLLRSGSQVLMGELERLADEGVFGEDDYFSLGGAPDEQSRALGELDATFSAWVEMWGHLLPRPWRFARTRNFAQIDPAALARAKGEGDADGWVEWHGGENPVPGRLVQIKWRTERGLLGARPLLSDALGWRDPTIIAYRLAALQEPGQ